MPSCFLICHFVETSTFLTTTWYKRMAHIEKLLAQLKNNPKNVNFTDLAKFAIIILENLDSKEQVIVSIKHLGLEIHALTFKKRMEKQRLIKLNRF